MEQIDLDFGDSITGLLVDYEDDTPYVGATLRLTPDEGIVVEVPYVLHRTSQQFAHVRSWFENEELPASLVLLTSDGVIGLFENRWRSCREVFGYGSASIGRFCPSVTTLGVAPKEKAAHLVVREVDSWIDGLAVWSPMTAVKKASVVDGQGCAEALEINAESNSVLVWNQGDARLELRTTWEGGSIQDGYKQRIFVDGNVSIASEFESGAKGIHDHLSEHQKFKDLMTFIFGCQLSFRRHCLHDEHFDMRFINGDSTGHIPFVEFVSLDTVEERQREVPEMRNLGKPIAELAEIGVDGLQAWARKYDEWERFILPSVNVLGRRCGSIEDSVISTCMSIEAAASKMGAVRGEECVGGARGRRNLPIAACVYRCLKTVDIQWPDRISSLEGLAKAIANVYNSIKHADRGRFPDVVKVRVICRVNEMIVRMLAVYVAGAGERVFPRYRKSVEVESVVSILSKYDCRIKEDGSWDIGCQ